MLENDEIFEKYENSNFSKQTKLFFLKFWEFYFNLKIFMLSNVLKSIRCIWHLKTYVFLFFFTEMWKEKGEPIEIDI